MFLRRRLRREPDLLEQKNDRAERSVHVWEILWWRTTMESDWRTDKVETLESASEDRKHPAAATWFKQTNTGVMAAR